MWQATGLAVGSTCSSSGGLPLIKGSFCFSQVLKVELRYLSRMYCFSMGRLASVAAQGRRGESLGGKHLVGQLQLSSPALHTPLLEHGDAVEA